METLLDDVPFDVVVAGFLKLEADLVTVVPLEGFVTVVPLVGFVTVAPLAGLVTVAPLEGLVTAVPLVGLVTVVPVAGRVTVVPLVGLVTEVPLAGLLVTAALLLPLKEPFDGLVTCVLPFDGLVVVEPLAGLVTLVPLVGLVTVVPLVGLVTEVTFVGLVTLTPVAEAGLSVLLTEVRLPPLVRPLRAVDVPISAAVDLLPEVLLRADELPLPEEVAEDDPTYLPPLLMDPELPDSADDVMFLP